MNNLFETISYGNKKFPVSDTNNDDSATFKHKKLHIIFVPARDLIGLLNTGFTKMTLLDAVRERLGLTGSKKCENNSKLNDAALEVQRFENGLKVQN